jgi:hypothetical protein
MTGEIGNALEVLGAINKEAARRIERLEDDLYGKDGLRVLITTLATRLEDVPEKLDALTTEVSALKVAEQNHADSVKTRKTIFKETLKWASKASAPLLAGVIGALTHRHFSGH